MSSTRVAWNSVLFNRRSYYGALCSACNYFSHFVGIHKSGKTVVCYVLICKCLRISSGSRHCLFGTQKHAGTSIVDVADGKYSIRWAMYANHIDTNARVQSFAQIHHIYEVNGTVSWIRTFELPRNCQNYNGSLLYATYYCSTVLNVLRKRPYRT